MHNKFSFSTVKNFDDHIDKSIRGYKDLIEYTKFISSYFIRSDTYVIDIGCSTGKLLSDISNQTSLNGHTARFIGYELDDNFSDEIEIYHSAGDNISFEMGNIFEKNLPVDISFAMSIFTLQFMTYHQRNILLKKVFDNMTPGSCFITSEKIISESSRIQDIITSLYYEYKTEFFEYKEIIDKEISLRNMMNLKTLSDSVAELEAIGFTSVEVFWRNYNFVGIIAIK